MNPFLNKDALWNITRKVRNEEINQNEAIQELLKIVMSSNGRFEFHFDNFKYLINKDKYIEFCTMKTTSFITVSEDKSNNNYHHRVSVLQAQQEDEEKQMLVICSAFRSVYQKLGRKGKRIFLDKFIYFKPATRTISDLNISNRYYYSELKKINKGICKFMKWESKNKEREAIVKLFNKFMSTARNSSQQKACQEFLKNNFKKWELEDYLY